MKEFSENVSRITVSSTLAVVMEAERYRAEGVDLVDLGAGEPDFPTPENIKQAAIRAIQENFTRYTPTAGTAELKRAICGWHAREFGSSYEPAEVLVTAGGKHAIFNAACALLDPGDEAVIPVPYWVSFRDIVQFAGGTCVFVPTREEDGYELSAEALERALTPRTRLVILNSPNNPSGAVIRPETAERIARTVTGRGIWLLSDECYSHFVYQGNPHSIGGRRDEALRRRLVVVGSLSKTFAMTGWRAGYALAPRELIGEMLKLQSHSTSNISSITQKAAVEALTGPQDSVVTMREEYRRRRDFVVAGLGEIPGLTCQTPCGAFYVYPNVGAFLRQNGVASTTDLAARLLREAHVAVVPGEAFGTSEHIRISYATSVQELGRGLQRMKEFFARLENQC